MSDSSVTNTIPVPTYIKAMAPYQAGKPIEELAREFNLDPKKIIKLASNENPLGMPESAKQAIRDVLDQLARYPDANGYDLKSALSKHYDLPMNYLTLGNGSNDLLDLIAHTFLTAGQSAVYSKHAFMVYSLATQAVGAKAKVTPTKAYGHDLEAMFDAIDESTKLVFIANPNNPTGTFIPAAQIEAFLQRVHDTYGQKVVVVLDEAYNEFLAPELRVNSAKWVKQFDNLIVSRTFSKAYALAGLRVGFAMANPTLTDLMNRIRQPFNVNSLAQAAAIAVLDDHAFLQQSYEVNRAGYQQLTQAFDDMGLEYVPSSGNFVLMKPGKDAAAVNLGLLRRGVIVRPVVGDGLPDWLRISIGLESENAQFLQALREVLKA